jgi:two-component system alkaline phosphatase synthesis response regulator PhoP
MMRPKILLIEDEEGLILTLGHRLEAEGYQIEAARDGDSGLELALRTGYDLIVLDLMLPGKSGMDVCRELRQKNLGVPVLMLTARDQVLDKVVGLKLGADDYVTKPFEMAELLARIEALLRRASSGRTPALTGVFRFGEVEVDWQMGEVRRGGATLSLSAREFRLLQYLAQNPHQVLSRNKLLQEVWNYNHMPATRTVDVHVAWLRQKLEPNPRLPVHIVTVHGLGYKFVP